MMELIATNRDGVQAFHDACTPSSLECDPDGDRFAALELGSVLELVASYASGPLGADRVRARRPATVPAEIEMELAPVGELLALAAKGDLIDVPPVPDLAPVLSRLRVEGSVLNGTELLLIRQTIAAGRIAHTELTRVSADAPRAAALAAPPPDRALERRLAGAIDDNGELLDTASPRLQAARREIHAARERLLKKLASILHGIGDAAPPGSQVTIRGDRYVIPVRRDSRSRPDGIVHDESASHGTLFLEPMAAIEVGNALRSALVSAEREALAVLRELTDRCRPERELLARLHAMCVAGDDLLARVRYALAVGGVPPVIGGERLILTGARHPLLLARGVPVVPFDLELDVGERTLLISGPNAGGKTVLLKTVGLAVLMTQSGIVPPLGPGSALPVFDRVFADIGDHQSLAADLSTFSAHLVSLRRALVEAGPATLVLIDEIGSGTDPAEGGALAAAALRAFTTRGVRSVATTHLGALKTLAGDVPGIVNGSLDFDAEQLRPTFRFRKGVPGRSYGLAIARRLGLDPDVLALAGAAVPDRERALDDLLAHVEARARTLEARAADLEAREAGVSSRESVTREIEAEQEARRKELVRRERDAEKAGRREARRLLLDARATVEAALREARAAGQSEEARRVRREIEAAVQAETEALEGLDAGERGGADPGAIRPGQRVRLAAGGVGAVLEVRSDGRVMVALGAVKVVVAAGDLTIVPGEAPRTPPPPRAEPEAGSAPGEIDLRGFRTDEAESATVAALDAAVLADAPLLRIIHGMGTGAVRDRVRQVLQADRRVARFDFAPRQQGGTGVTIVEFAGG